MKVSLIEALCRGRVLFTAGRNLRAACAEPGSDARALARARLCEVLGDARGIAMKLGQLLATDAADDPLRALVSSVRPLPLADLRADIEDALGGPLGEAFASFDESRAAASLGQVHRARTCDGVEVAVKVRYPSIVPAVRAELALSGLLPSLGPARRWGFDLAGYKRALAQNMACELDYVDEARRQARFRAEVRTPGLVVPAVLPALCRESLLVQTWEDGLPLAAARSFTKEERLELGRILLETMFASLFGAGLVHGDPHPGNYLVRPATEGRRAELVLLDYGCTIEIPRRARLALLQLIARRRAGDRSGALATYAALGFDAPKLASLGPALDTLTDALLAPLCTEGSFRTAAWPLSRTIEETCGELKWWFRAAAPPELLLLVRQLQGTIAHLEALDVALPWWPILGRAVGPALLAEAESLVLATAPEAPGPALRARFLRVHVERAHGEPCSLALPAREALRLRETMPQDLAARIAGRGIDLRDIEARVLRSGGAPGELFCDAHDGGSVRVWLE